MKKILIPILLILLLVGCKPQPKESYTINGTITGEIPNYIYLYNRDKIDSSLVKNGTFNFKGKVDRTSGVYFHIKNNSSMIDDRFYLENKNIEIEISNQIKTINGLELNFIKIDKINGSETELLSRKFKSFSENNWKKSNWNSILYSKLDSIITLRPKNVFSYDILLHYISKKELESTQIINLFKKLDTTDLSIVQLEKIHREINPNRILSEGKHIYDFALPNPNDKMISTLGFRGKILLIDFWASWCKPCRKLNPELIEIYKEFKESNFEILGVSLDTEKEKWKNAISKDRIPWENIIDTLAFEGKVSAKYNIHSIPSNILIGKNGIIMGKNISIENLRKILTD